MPIHDGTRYTAVIADDHALIRAGISAALARPGLIEADGIEIVAEACNGLQTIERVKAHRPDLLILDISMPMASGAEILTDVRRWSPQTKIVVMTAVTSPGLLAGLVEAGVDGLFAKAADNEEFFSRLPLILRGARYVAEPLAALLRDAAPAPALTDRERQTLNMIIAGRSNREIAAGLGISIKTVDKHRTSLMQKLDVSSVAQLVARALKEGLIDPAKEL